jgi:hypothetical protein
MASLIRILLLGGLVFAGFQIYPKFAPEIQKIKENPQVLGETVSGPVLGTINSVLPDYLQIKSKSAPVVDNNALQKTSNEIFTGIKDKATDLANDQVDALKKEAGKQFCAVLLERVKQECNLTQTP